MVGEGEEEPGWVQTLHLKVCRPNQKEQTRSKIPRMPRVKLRLTGVSFYRSPFRFVISCGMCVLLACMDLYNVHVYISVQCPGAHGGLRVTATGIRVVSHRVGVGNVTRVFYKSKNS